jgi:hypothetical protein
MSKKAKDWDRFVKINVDDTIENISNLDPSGNEKVAVKLIYGMKVRNAAGELVKLKPGDVPVLMIVNALFRGVASIIMDEVARNKLTVEASVTLVAASCAKLIGYLESSLEEQLCSDCPDKNNCEEKCVHFPSDKEKLVQVVPIPMTTPAAKRDIN